MKYVVEFGVRGTYNKHFKHVVGSKKIAVQLANQIAHLLSGTSYTFVYRRNVPTATWTSADYYVSYERV